MDFIRILYALFILVVAVDAIAGVLVAWRIYLMRRRLGWYIARAFTGSAVDTTVMFLTMFISQAPARVIAWVVALRILTRIYKTYEMARLGLFLHGYINGDHPEVMKEEKK